MHITLSNFSARTLEIDTKNHTYLTKIIKHEITTRDDIQHHTIPRWKQDRELLTVPFTTRILDEIPLTAILKESFTPEHLPNGVFENNNLPLIVFANTHTIGSMLFNVKHNLKDMTMSQLQDVDHMSCDCHKPEYKPFINDKLKHVASCDLNFVRDPPLRHAMDHGTKFRPTMTHYTQKVEMWLNKDIHISATGTFAQHLKPRHPNPPNDLTNKTSHPHKITDPSHLKPAKAETLGLIYLAIDNYIKKLAHKEEMDPDMFNQFRNTFMTHLETYLDRIKSIDSHPIENTPIPHKAILNLRKKWTITSCDKLSQTYCILCPKLTMQWLIKEHFPEGMDTPGNDPTYQQLNTSQETELTRLSKLQHNLGMVWKPQHTPKPIPGSTEPPPKPEPTLGEPAITVKQHKTPPKPRTLVDCSSFILRPLSLLVTNALAALEPVLKHLWQKTFGALPHELQPLFPILTSSYDIPGIVERVNRHMSHKQDYTCRKTTADCTQMYTKIPIEDCLQQHYQLIDKCFEIQNSDEYKEHGGYTVPTDDPAYHRRAVGVQINRTKSSNAGIMVGQQKGRWNWVYRSDLHKNATLPNGKLKAKGQYEFFVSCHLLKKWLRLLLNNVIISFGQDIVLKQRIGLPMGIAPAVFCANYYCFAYEFEFFKQLIDQRHHPLLQEFCFYSRYVPPNVLSKCPSLRCHAGCSLRRFKCFLNACTGSRGRTPRKP